MAANQPNPSEEDVRKAVEALKTSSDSKEKNSGGRPRNVNERELDEALAPIIARLARIEDLGPAPSPGEDNRPVGRGWFFLHLFTGMTIHRGEAAFNPVFLETVQNNADDFYETYVNIVKGTHQVQKTTRAMLDEAQQRLAAVDREKEDLRDRLRELEREAMALTQGSDEGEEQGEAAPETA